MIEKLNALVEMLQNANKITVLTGAGMSTESGIPDFRSAGGLWEDTSLESTMTRGGLIYRPKEFWPKYKQVFFTPEMLHAVPNLGHYAIASLEKIGKDVTIFTQNVDGLHQKAGSSKVFEMHGTIETARCPRKHATRYDLPHLLQNEIPRCSHVSAKGHLCNTILHPDAVLFGQTVKHFKEASKTIAESDLLLIMGTSLKVKPVNQLPRYVDPRKTTLVIVNLEPTDEDDRANLVIHHTIGFVMTYVMWHVAYRYVDTMSRKTE